MCGLIELLPTAACEVELSSPKLLTERIVLGNAPGGWMDRWGGQSDEWTVGWTDGRTFDRWSFEWTVEGLNRRTIGWTIGRTDCDNHSH